MDTRDALFVRNRLGLLDRVESTLSLPPAKSWTVRPNHHGDRVMRFVLPLDVCATTNATRHGQSWKLGETKGRVWDLMLTQARALREHPLPGRPQVIAIRFAPNEPDPYSDWAKVPVDMLRMWRQKRSKIGRKVIVTKVRGLGFITDDQGRYVELSQHWEPAKRGQGFVYIEVRKGVAA